MTDSDILRVVREELARIAPDIDFDAVDRTRPIQREFDIDSMDFLNLVTALHARLGVDIPERDYAKAASIDGLCAYIAAAARPSS